jgi:hypothetical protein
MLLFLNGGSFVEYIWSTSATPPLALAQFLSDKIDKGSAELVSAQIPAMRVQANTSLGNYAHVAHAIQLEKMTISGEGVSFGGSIAVDNELNARLPRRRVVVNRPFWLRLVDPHKQTLFVGWFDDPGRWVSAPLGS